MYGVICPNATKKRLVEYRLYLLGISKELNEIIVIIIDIVIVIVKPGIVHSFFVADHSCLFQDYLLW